MCWWLDYRDDGLWWYNCWGLDDWGFVDGFDTEIWSINGGWADCRRADVRCFDAGLDA